MLADLPSDDINGITSEDEESSESDNIVDDIDYCPLEIDENPEEENGNSTDSDVSAEIADLADSTSNERERVRHARVKMPKPAQVLNAGKGNLLSKIPKPKLVVAQVEYIENYIFDNPQGEQN
jgi:hypothetical protein